MEPRRPVHVVSESRSTLKLRISATVPIICNTGNSCSILVQMTTDTSEVLLSVCMLEFKHGAANQTQIVQVAAKRDFVLDGDHIVKLRLNAIRRDNTIEWNNHVAIPALAVCLCYLM